MHTEHESEGEGERRRGDGDKSDLPSRAAWRNKCCDERYSWWTLLAHRFPIGCRTQPNSSFFICMYDFFAIQRLAGAIVFCCNCCCRVVSVCRCLLFLLASIFMALAGSVVRSLFAIFVKCFIFIWRYCRACTEFNFFVFIIASIAIVHAYFVYTKDRIVNLYGFSVFLVPIVANSFWCSRPIKSFARSGITPMPCVLGRDIHWYDTPKSARYHEHLFLFASSCDCRWLGH